MIGIMALTRAECTLCHTMAAKYVLGVSMLQMNKLHDYGGVVANQHDTLNHLGMFTKPLEMPASKLVRLADYCDTEQSLDARARSCSTPTALTTFASGEAATRSFSYC